MNYTDEELTQEVINPGRPVEKQDVLKTFILNQKLKSHPKHYTTTEEFVSNMDAICEKLSYNQLPGLNFRYKNIEHDYDVNFPSKEMAEKTRYPTLEYYPYSKNTDTLAQIFLYDSVALQHARIPKVLLITNEENEEFKGYRFDMKSFSEPHQKFLHPLSEKIKIKRISKKEMIKAIS